VTTGRWHFCIRDDDTSYFTRPEELERAYGRITDSGPVSLAVVPFCRAGFSKAVPEHLRGTWSVHALEDNAELVAYLRQKVAEGRFEIMLHGYYHDERDGRPEFVRSNDLERRTLDGRQYLERLLNTTVSVFVPPHNSIRRHGLRAIVNAGLHLGGAAGVRGGWPLLSPGTWRLWWALRQWDRRGGAGVPWVLDLGDHCEIAGNPVTPVSRLHDTRAALDRAADVGGVFCAATHYWEFDVASQHAGDPSVRGHLSDLISRALELPGTSWQSVGQVVATGDRLNA
jgi:Predicted deacetylase